MKIGLMMVGLVCLAVGGCAGSDGNPDGMAYAGVSGSLYDAAANPPRNVGVVTYDATAANPEPSDLRVPGPARMPGMPQSR